MEYVKVEGKHDVHARFFERGAGETQSSGTGSCASAVAAMSTGRANRRSRSMRPVGRKSFEGREIRFFLRGPRPPDLSRRIFSRLSTARNACPLPVANS